MCRGAAASGGFVGLLSLLHIRALLSFAIFTRSNFKRVLCAEYAEDRRTSDARQLPGLLLHHTDLLLKKVLKTTTTKKK